MVHVVRNYYPLYFVKHNVQTKVCKSTYTVPSNGHGLHTSHVAVCTTVGHEVYQHEFNIPEPAEL